MADDGDTLVGSSYCCVVILYELHDAVLSDCKIIMFHHLSLKTDVQCAILFLTVTDHSLHLFKRTKI
jgi:hypothetical protein